MTVLHKAMLVGALLATKIKIKEKKHKKKKKEKKKKRKQRKERKSIPVNSIKQVNLEFYSDKDEQSNTNSK